MVCAETAAVYEYLTVWEHMEFIARAYRLDGDWHSLAERLLARFELADKRTNWVRNCLKDAAEDQYMLCSLINPRMIMFDEPMMGLDPKAIKELKNIFELKKRAVPFDKYSYYREYEEVWDRVLIMNKGKVVLSRTRSELENRNETLEEIFFDTTEGGWCMSSLLYIMRKQLKNIIRGWPKTTCTYRILPDRALAGGFSCYRADNAFRNCPSWFK